LGTGWQTVTLGPYSSVGCSFNADKLGCCLASHVVDDDVLGLAELVHDVAELKRGVIKSKHTTSPSVTHM
jgi:hypothetical protein